MKKLLSNEIRKMWIDFFKSKNHYFLEPASLVPVEDPSLLWINSGVATLKPYFDGRLNPPSSNLVNSQKAIRTNDIENVGVTARHQTMFEMLGNFSIGGYFKKEAIIMAWELLTSKDWFAIDPEFLYITVYQEDQEAYEVWTKEIGIKEDHIFKGTRDTNFWDIGQGPCGPNTEIFFDRGIKWDPKNLGPRLLKDDIENDRYIEIWNIVFSEFNNDGAGNYTELPRKNIDTGAGLERIASIFQDTPTNFETDLFLPTIKSIESICDSKFKYSIRNYFNENKEQTKINTAFKVIADHIRAATFAIADGVYPGNKDRGYIIRRLIRRSTVYGKKLGIIKPFLFNLVDDVIKAMSNFYSYLIEKTDSIKNVIKQEEERFLLTLNKGYEHLENIINLEKKVSGKNALLLFESFGFPIELTIEIANDLNVEVELEQFNKLLEQVKELARSSRKNDKALNKQSEVLLNLKVESEFVGYEVNEIETQINFMFINEKQVDKVEDEIVYLTLKQTPFYAEKGGQAADNGILVDTNNNSHNVIDVQVGPNKQHIHKVQVNGILSINDKVIAKINEEKRFYTMKNHSGTHLLQAAIQEVLGKQALQNGSYNDENGLRIDISFNRAPNQQEIDKMHEVLEREIKNATPREIIYCSLEQALNEYNALALFTEKYDETVRVIKFGIFSCELCGGTHVQNTKEVEDIFITDVESKGSGVYRYHAVTSFKEVSNYLISAFEKQKLEIKPLIEKFNEYKTLIENEEIQKEINDILQVKIEKQNLASLKIKVNEFKNKFKLYQKEVEDKLTSQKIEKYLNYQPVEKQDYLELIIECNDISIKEIKELVDIYQNKYSRLVIYAKNLVDKLFVVSVNQSLTDNYKAIDLFNNNKEYKLKGGGNQTLAQGKILD